MLPFDQRPLTLRTTFDSVAEEYDAVRPDYPTALVDDVLTFADIPANGTILEIGCGTGQATIPFAQHGYQMTCLDIGPALAARATANTQSFPNVRIHVCAFEDWPPTTEMFDLVMSATAFHWIPPEIGYPKAATLLKRTGTLALFSNEHPTPFTDFFADAQAVYQRFVPSWSNPQQSDMLDVRIAQTTTSINNTGLFAPVIVRTYAWFRSYSTEMYLRLLNTYSDHLHLNPSVRTQLEHGLAALIDTKYGGIIMKPYLAVLYLAKRR